MIALLTALGSEASIAISPQDAPGEVKACNAISNDKERLKCFDNLFGGTATPEKSEEGKPADWTIEESKSPADGSPPRPYGGRWCAFPRPAR